MEEEIDLRVYIELLIKRWSWLVGLSLIGAIMAWVVSLFLTATYEAEAQVLIIKSQTDISFEPRIKSETVENPLNGDRNADRNAMASLVRSNEVAGQVLNQVGDSLPEEARQASKLLKKVDVNNDGNLIMIKVKDPDPELAAEIANVWANSFETYINKLFNEQKGHLMVQVRS
jgi:capsular polysaccharide biosynthesis protein